MSERIAILDVGKTNAKLSLVDATTGRQTWSVRRANESVETTLGRQLDVAGIERWLLQSLAAAPEKAHIVAIVPIGHGASAVLVDAKGNVLCAPDYEDERFDSIAAEYAPHRDRFAETLSPPLPLGLNLGRQLFYLQEREPELFAATHRALLYPQYWAWRLCGEQASECTSLGCHTDLWRPAQRDFSNLVARRGWRELFAPLRTACETLGHISASVASATGLDPRCRVACGIHDSNASFLQHLLNRPRHLPFAVLSSGTWTVLMASGVALERLRADQDMLANVNVYGAPVATARFMGGREYEAIAGNSVLPELRSLTHVVGRNAFVLPSFAAAGPFHGRKGSIENDSGLNPAERAALGTLYVALMTDYLMDLLAVRGDVLVDGPLAANPLFTPLLAALRPDQHVLAHAQSSSVRAACHLAGVAVPAARPVAPTRPLYVEGLEAYVKQWRSRVA